MDFREFRNLLTGETKRFHPRPAVYAAAGAAVGCLLFGRLAPAACILLGTLLMMAGAWMFYRQYPAFTLPLVLGLLLLRTVLLPAALTPGLHTFTGRVMSLPEETKAGTELTVRLSFCDGERQTGRVTLVLRGRGAPSFGDTVSASGFFTPDGQKESAFFLGTVRAQTAETVGSGGFSLYGLALRARQTLEERADALFSPDAGEAKGMLFGDRSDMTYRSYRAYRRSGLMHLLCVSGLHCGVVGGAALFLIRGRRRWVRYALSCLVLLFYCALTGFSPSALRAALMLLLARLTLDLERQRDLISAVSLAFAILLLFDPYYLNKAGFQLSFGAVYGIACLGEPLRKPVPKPIQPLVAPFAVSLAACLGTLPLLCRITGEVQWAGVLLSPAALAAAPFFLLPGWLAVLVYGVSPGLAALLALIPRGVLVFLSMLAELAPGKALALPAPGGAVLLFWFAGLFMLSPYYLPNGKKPPCIGLALLGAGLLAWLLL